MTRTLDLNVCVLGGRTFTRSRQPFDGLHATRLVPVVGGPHVSVGIEQIDAVRQDLPDERIIDLPCVFDFPFGQHEQVDGTRERAQRREQHRDAIPAVRLVGRRHHDQQM